VLEVPFDLPNELITYEVQLRQLSGFSDTENPVFCQKAELHLRFGDHTS
jgi:hypothetical protein